MVDGPEVDQATRTRALQLLTLTARNLDQCWDELVAALDSTRQETGHSYALAHLSEALADLEYALDILGPDAPPETRAKHVGCRGRFEQVVAARTGDLRRLAHWEWDYLSKRYDEYLSDLPALQNPDLRQGEIYSIISVRNAMEALLKLPDRIGLPAEDRLRVARWDRMLREFISNVPWHSWVIEDNGGFLTDVYSARYWWWGRGR